MISDSYFEVSWLDGKLSKFHEYEELEAPYFIFNGTLSDDKTDFEGRVSVRSNYDSAVELIHDKIKLKIYEESSIFTQENCLMVCRDGTSLIGQFKNQEKEIKHFDGSFLH